MKRSIAALALPLLVAAACGQHADVGRPARAARVFGVVAPGPAPQGGPAETLSAAAVPPVDEDAEFVSWPQWAALLLPRLGAPVCENNVVSVVAWAAQENTEAGWNPLATTLQMPGSTRFNSHGVQDYLSLEQGLEATVLTIQQGLYAHRYGPIVEALQRCADPMVTARAIRRSSWCRGCSSGRYVTGIVRVIRATLRRSA